MIKEVIKMDTNSITVVEAVGAFRAASIPGASVWALACAVDIWLNEEGASLSDGTANDVALALIRKVWRQFFEGTIWDGEQPIKGEAGEFVLLFVDASVDEALGFIVEHIEEYLIDPLNNGVFNFRNFLGALGVDDYGLVKGWLRYSGYGLPSPYSKLTVQEVAYFYGVVTGVIEF